MRFEHFEALSPLCPACRRRHGDCDSEDAGQLHVDEIAAADDTHIIHGRLRCARRDCAAEFPIIDRVPILVADTATFIQGQLPRLLARTDLPPTLRGLLGDCAGADSWFDQDRRARSIYVRDHYGAWDPLPTRPTHTAPGSTERLLSRALDSLDVRPDGAWLDLGCSVGGTSVQLARDPGRLVLGIDTNFALLATAQQIAASGQVDYDLRLIGNNHEARSHNVPIDAHVAARVDFWLCDALHLPFRSAQFGGIAALNLIDSVEDPLALLAELARNLRADGRSILTTPWDWNAGVTPPARWIGGHSQRNRHGGRPDGALDEALALDGVRLRQIGNLSEAWKLRLSERSSVEYDCFVSLLAHAPAAPAAPAAPTASTASTPTN